MDKWFFNTFTGSSVPITYEHRVKAIHPYTGEEVMVIQKEIIGVVHTDDLHRFMSEMEKIQAEVKK